MAVPDELLYHPEDAGPERRRTVASAPGSPTSPSTRSATSRVVDDHARTSFPMMALLAELPARGDQHLTGHRRAQSRARVRLVACPRVPPDASATRRWHRTLGVRLLCVSVGPVRMVLGR